MALTPMAAYRNDIPTYMSPAYVVVSIPQAVSIPNTTDTTIDFTSSGTVEAHTNDGMFSTSNSDRVTIKRSGLYLATANVSYASDADGYRTVWVVSSSTTVAEIRIPGYDAVGFLSCSGLFYAETGTAIVLKFRHSAGAALDLNTARLGVVMLK